MPKSLLVIDPLPTNRIRLSAILEAAQYDATTVTMPDEAQAVLRSDPDLVVFGLHGELPELAMAALRKAGLNPEIPVVFLDGVSTPQRRLLALRAGARDLMPIMLPDALLLARLRSLIRESDAGRECERRRVTASSFGFAEARAHFTQPSRVVCIMAASAPDALRDRLQSALPYRLEFLGLEDALRDDTSSPDVDAYLIVPDTCRDTLDHGLPELRDRSHSRHAPVLVIHRTDGPNTAVRALNLGASDIAADDASGDEIAIRVDEMLRAKRLRDRLRKTDEQSYRLAATDPLTGLYNRRYADSYLADLLMREKVQGKGYGLMLVDLDHFKSINDTHGHGAGDQVLCEVARRLRDNLRAGDLVARYGGEEFLVVLPDTDAAEGESTAERLRRAIGATEFALSTGEGIRVTASIGVSFGGDRPQSGVALKTGTFDVVEAAPAMSLAHLFDAADAALYRAKSAGRNRVEFNAV